jgi:hypothetical protein
MVLEQVSQPPLSFERGCIGRKVGASVVESRVRGCKKGERPSWNRMERLREACKSR